MTDEDWATFWTNLDDFWTTWGTPLSIFLILGGAYILRSVLIYVLRKTVDQVVSGVRKSQKLEDTQAIVASPLHAVRVVQRTRTLGSVLSNVISVVVYGIAIIAVLDKLGVPVLGIVGTAGVVAAGLAFGAQNIVKDMLNGLFMVFEDQLGVGDVVDLGPATGMVEYVGIRITKVRDVNGTLWFVRNGEIMRVGNMSQGWSRVIIDLAVPYDVDIEAVEATMLATATEMATKSKWRTNVLEKPEIWGIESISGEAVVVRLVLKTKSQAKDDVARELRARLKKALDAMGIKLPSLQSIVLSGFEGATSVKGAKQPRTMPMPVASTAGPTTKAPKS